MRERRDMLAVSSSLANSVVSSSQIASCFFFVDILYIASAEKAGSGDWECGYVRPLQITL